MAVSENSVASGMEMTLSHSVEKPGRAKGSTEDGIPLTVYKVTRIITLPIDNLKTRSTYAQGQGQWRAGASVSLKFRTMKSLMAYRAALLWATGDKFSRKMLPQFNSHAESVFVAAILFGLNDLVDIARREIIDQITPRTILKLYSLAERCGDKGLEHAVFGWILRSGLLSTPLLVSTPSRMVVDALLLGKSNPAEYNLERVNLLRDSGVQVDCQSGNIVSQKLRLPVSRLEKWHGERVRRTSHYFSANYDMRGTELCHDPSVSGGDFSSTNFAQESKEMTSETQTVFATNRESPEIQRTLCACQPAHPSLCPRLSKVLKATGVSQMRRCILNRYLITGDLGIESHWDFVLREETTQHVLLAARYRSGSGDFVFTNRYPSKFIRHDEDFVADLSSNFYGTCFTIHDIGCTAAEGHSGIIPSMMQREHGAIVYEQNVLGRVPNAMKVCIIDPNEIHHTSSVKETMFSRFQKKDRSIKVLKTKTPIWNSLLESWTMNFSGRVLLSSKRNFQLIDVDGGGNEAVLLSFGKFCTDSYTLDWAAPLTPIQAFAVALSTFADKLMVT